LVDKPQDESIKDKIIELLGKGYNRSQLIKDFEFAQRTVDNAIKKYKEEHGDDRGEGKEVTGTPGRDGGFLLCLLAIVACPPNITLPSLTPEPIFFLSYSTAWLLNRDSQFGCQLLRPTTSLRDIPSLGEARF